MSIFNKFKKAKDEEKVEPVVSASASGSAKTKKVKAVKSEESEKKEIKLEIEKEAKPEVKVKDQSKKEIYGILVRPLVTEKSGLLASANQYIFLVDVKANKIQVAAAILSRYGVKPTSVNIINREGKYVRYGKNYGQTKGYKKAIITLPKGKSIEVYEGN